MSATAVALREGERLVRASPTRTAVIALTIGAATTLGVLAGALAVGCCALSFAVLVVARRSPRPEQMESASAWRRVGAPRWSIWLSGVVEALLLGWIPTIAGGVVGTIAKQATDSRAATGSGVSLVVWQLVALAVAACLPTARLGRSPRHALRHEMTRAWIGVRLWLVGFATLAMFQAARGIRSDFDLGLGGLLIVFLLTLVSVVVSAPAMRGLTSALGRIGRLRALVAIAARYRLPGTVRLVIVACLTIATAAAVLGASVESRPDVQHVVDQELAALPVLPRNVARIQIEAWGLAALDPARARPAFTADARARIRALLLRAVPGAEVIELRDLGLVVGSPAVPCDGCVHGPLVIADPRLRSIYGGDRRYVVPRASFEEPSSPLVAHGATRVRPDFEIYRDALAARALPPASFDGAVYYEVPAADAGARPTAVRSIFLRAPAALTRTQLAQLANGVRHFPTPVGTVVALDGPRGQLVPLPGSGFPIPVSGTLREAPWAATSTSSRWSIAVAAGLLALIALLVTMTIDTIDRRADVRRIERIGATPGQVRGAAALHAAVTFVVVTWSTALLVSALVVVGTRAFNHAEPDIPVPFMMPWPVVIVLTVGLPVAAAALSAIVARPAASAESR